jgi:Flp pilus assembly protein TadD
VLLEEYKRTQSIDVLDEAQRAFLRAQDLYRDAGPGDFVTRDDLLQANLGNGWFHFFAAQGGHLESTFAEAEAVFDTIAAMRPDSAEALTGRGVARLYVGKLAEAEADLAAAAERNPRDFGAWYWLGRARARVGQPARAAEAFERALALRPDDREATLLLAAARAEAGERETARRLLAQAHAAWPDDPEVMLQLGRVSAMDGRRDTARSWFERALQLDGEFGPAYLELGKLHLLEGTPPALQEAVLALDRACRLMPSDFEAHYDLGVVLVRLGAPADALPRLERALALDPEHPLADQLRTEIERLREEVGR